MSHTSPGQPTLVNESLLQRFRASWVAGTPEPLAGCLPEPNTAEFLSTLEELVALQLEFAWKAHVKGGERPVSVQILLKDFPELGAGDRLPRLLRQEFHCRALANDTPSAEEYREVFPETDLDQLAIPPGEASGPQASGGTAPGLSPDDQATLPPPATGSIADDVTLEPPAAATPLADQQTVAPPSGSSVPGSIHDDATIPPRHAPDAPIEAGEGTLPSDPSVALDPAKQVPGYEVQRELGRGGMGVVYRALDTRLKRVVALKMILSGGHAGDEDLQRFQREAEAVAQLQHPNIVQIHDVGEHDGQPFFSLEFVEGGGLDEKTGGEPQPPLEAAALVEKLAGAVHFAHERNIVHRDLKLANVLLTAEGEPKITDFGLAKRLGDDSSQTASGSIMGTPSYMAPEQAGNQAAEIGPHTDVYALGAILYCLLTGRPPFQSSSVMDTVMLVLEQEPVPPRQLVAGLDKNLETITLKCLQKAPERRYQSGKEVAEELRRFQAGEPIEARPVGQFERAWRWCKRRPTTAGLVAGVVVSLVAGTVVSSMFAVSEYEQRKIAQDNQQRAEERFGQAVSVVDKLVQVCEHLAFYPGVQDDRVELLQLAGRYYQDLADDESGGRELRINSARTLLKLAGVFEQLGDSEKSLEVFRDSESRLQSLQEPGGEQDGLPDTLADCRIRIAGVLTRSGNTGQATATLESVLQSLGERPGGPLGGELTARACYILAEIAIEEGALDQAAGKLETAVVQYRQLSEQPDVSVDLVFGLATSLSLHGEVLSALESLDEAIVLFKEAETLLRDRVVTSDDVDPRHAKQLAVTRSLLAAVFQQLDREAESIEALEATIVSLDALVQLVPDAVDFHEDYARAMVNMGYLRYQLEDSSTARIYVEKGREILISLHESTDSGEYIEDIAAAQLMLGLIQLDLESGDLDPAGDFLKGAINLFDQLRSNAPDSTQRSLTTNLAEAYLAQSILQERLGQVAEALSLANRARELLDRLVKDERGTTQLDALARCHQRRADLQERSNAAAQAGKSIALAMTFRKELAERGRYRRSHALLLARSDSTRPRAIEVARQLTLDQPTSYRAWLTLATVQIESELWSEADKTLQEAEKRAGRIPSARLHLLKAIALGQSGQLKQATAGLAIGRALLQKHAPARPELLDLARRAGKLVSMRR